MQRVSKHFPKTQLFLLILGIYAPLFILTLLVPRKIEFFHLALISFVSLFCGLRLYRILTRRLTSEKTHQFCLEYSRDAFFLIQADGKITKLNPQAEKISVQAVDQLRWSALSHSRLCLESSSRVIQNPGLSENLEGSFVFPLNDDRGSVLVRCEIQAPSLQAAQNSEMTIEPKIKEKALKLEAFNVELQKEINERRKAEEALRQIKEDYELIFHSVPAMIWYKDAHNRIIRANRSAAESMGRSVAELEGMSTYDLYPDLAAKYYEDDLHVIRTGKPKIGIVEPYQPFSGPKLWVRTDKIPYLDAKGEPGGVIVFAVDITESKQAEVKLIESTEKLKNMNEELDKFNCLVSHDLQEPLRTIFGFSDLLLKAEDKEAARDYATRIRDASARIREQLKDLLHYAKSHTEGESLFQEVSLERVLRDVTLDLSRLIEETETKLEIGKLPNVRGNSSQLYHLFLNLLSNAIKFRKDGQCPEISITAAEPENPLAVVRVSDKGIGFDSRQAERIFAPFQKLHSRQIYPGSGLGLSLCRKIIQQHGGTLTAAGNINEGAVFEIRLPKAACGHHTA